MFASHPHISVQVKLLFRQELDDLMYLLVPQPHVTISIMATGAGGKSEITGEYEPSLYVSILNLSETAIQDSEFC